MGERELQKIFIEILRSELTETELSAVIREQIDSGVVSELFTLSKKHDLAHIVSSALNKHGLITDVDMLSKLKKEEHLAIFRYEQMRFAYGQICNILEEAKIPYIPLKGSVVRPYYPKESMRTSCDIDILVEEKKLDTAVSALTKNGFVQGEKGYHDVSLYSPNKIHIELHFKIKTLVPVIDSLLEHAWTYADCVNDYRYEFSKDFFIFHIFAHMSCHFNGGGCGVRPLMDIWIIEHKMGIKYSDSKDLLEKAGIYKFAEKISSLVDVCFSGKPADDFSDTLLSYILNGGVYGSFENKMTVEKTRNSNVFIYALKRLFLPYDSMAVTYPVLKKMPILLPFCYVARFFKMIFGGKTKKAVNELKSLNSVTAGEAELMEKMRDNLGLK